MMVNNAIITNGYSAAQTKQSFLVQSLFMIFTDICCTIFVAYLKVGPRQFGTGASDPFDKQ